jgi:hypothetical protein
MKSIIVIFLSLIFPIVSIKKAAQKICINCKYFITDNKNDVYGRCSLFPSEKSKIQFLVNGVNEENYYYCSTTRSSNNMCGEEGTYYKKKKSKNLFESKNIELSTKI